MLRVKIIVFVILIFGLLFCGCGDKIPDSSTKSSDVLSSKSTIFVELKITKNDDFVITIVNNTKSPVIISPNPSNIAVIHETRNGKITFITFNVAAADMPLMSAFGLVYLLPYSQYVLTMAPERNKAYLIDRPGNIYAIVRALRPGNFDVKYQSEASKWPLLTRKLQSKPLNPASS